MLTVTHAVIGGAIGQNAPNPYFAFGLGLISHIILDKVPHFFSFKRPYKQIIIWSDTVATALLLVLLYLFHSGNHSGLLFGALGGVMVDLVLVIIFRERGRIAAWHTKRQIHKDSYLWLGPDLAFFIIGLTFIIVFR